MNIHCPKHGVVKFKGTGDFIGDDKPITMYCPKCVDEDRKRAKQKPPKSIKVTKCPE